MAGIHHESAKSPAPKAMEAQKPVSPPGQGYNGKEHDDVLRRVNRQPFTIDKKPTVVITDNVIAVAMPNRSAYRLTLHRAPQPKAVIVPEDVKTWEYTAPPVAST